MTNHHPRPEAVDLGEGMLWRLGTSQPIDARMSWRRPDTYGAFEPMNAYLLKGEGTSILVEAGPAIGQRDVEAQLTSIFGAAPAIERVAVTRNEPDTISNLPNLVTFAAVTQSWTPGVINPLDFFDDEGMFDEASAHLQMKSFGVAQSPALPGVKLMLDESRWLEPVQTPLRLLSTIWYYDNGSRALFCSDIFSSEPQAGGQQPVVTEVPDRADLFARMKGHLLQKYDWLAYSNLTEIILGLEELFAAHEIDILAPSRGCPIIGRAAVVRHQEVLLDVLRAVGRNRPAKPNLGQEAPKQDQSVVSTNRMVHSGFDTRDLGNGIHLLGGCFHAQMYGRKFHSHGSAYLIEGASGAAIVDTCHAKDAEAVAAFIRSRVGDKLTHIFPTHEEYPHAGNLGGLMAAFPEAKVVGDVRNYHLYFPEEFAAGRFHPCAAGDAIDLGGRALHMLPAVIHDLPNSLWAWDDKAQMMFVSDAFGFSHYRTDECMLFSEELPTPPSIEDTKQVLDLALYWTRFAEKSEIIAAMQDLFESYPTSMVGPAHGNVVSRPAELIPLMDEALLATTR